MQFYDFEDGRGHVPARQHANGGGWIALSAYVAPSVYVGICAVVFGYARVDGNARISGQARVGGERREGGLSTTICGQVTITDKAQILDCVMVTGHARIGGAALIYGNANISERVIVNGRARIGPFVSLKGEVYITDDVEIRGGPGCRVHMQGARLLHGKKIIDKTLPNIVITEKRRVRKISNAKHSPHISEPIAATA